MYQSADQYDKSEQFLSELSGTYEQLFLDVICDTKYDKLWTDYCSAIVGADSGEMMAQMMKSSTTGDIYGQAAIDAYSANPNDMRFDCAFTNDIAQFTFDGIKFSGTASDGNEVFAHEYTYIGDEYIGEEAGINGFGGCAYKSNDDNSGEFTYFIMLPDTPASTYHIEFRYGSDLDDLKQYATGDYAYWLAAGIPVGADDTAIEKVISLFCLENMDYSERSESSINQISDLIGQWECSVADYPELTDMGITGMYFEVTADGVGTTYAELNGSGEYIATDSYNAYMYDSSDADNSGIYVAYNLDTGSATGSRYVLTSDNVLTITTLDGEQIFYTKR